MKNNVIIFGASAHAKVVIDTIEQQNKYNIVGLVDEHRLKDINFFGYKIIGVDADLESLIQQHKIFGGIVAIGDNLKRRKIMLQTTKQFPNFKFITAIHPKTYIARDVSIGAGSLIMPGAIINSSTKIGIGCIVNTNASVDHDNTIQDYVSIAPGATTGGSVFIGEGTMLGLGAKVIDKIDIGEYSIIGAGSVVIKSIPNNVKAYGCPAKIIEQ